MTHSLLFEVGTEELPPSEMPAVLPALIDNARKLLEDARLGFETARHFATPRRLAIVVDGLADRQTPLTTTVTGPPKKAAYDAQGKPTKAAEGFARSQGVSIEQVRTVQTERGEYLAVERREAGRAAAEVLPELLERLVGSLPFAKQMRWGEGDVRFVRPVRWVVALLDAEVLPVTIAGVAAGRRTFGHRFLSPAPIELHDPAEYLPRLEAAFVVADVDARRTKIRRQVEAAAMTAGGDAHIDDATLESVTHLVEDAAPVVGTFAETFLDLPPAVIETPIRRHQRCFPIGKRDHGGLSAAFVAVTDMPGVDPTAIRRGNERVIRARLADADFYFREDLKITPEARVPMLKGIVFQERLGTLYEKTERLEALAEHLGAPLLAAQELLILRRAARLAKSDLASGMVREFPELQGEMGAVYAERAAEPDGVARAIAEHYRPRSADDPIPSSAAGALLAIADKLDTVVGCLGVGLMPTGSQDPYGLRRQAQGLVQIALGAGFRLSLPALVDRALALLAPKLTEPAEATRERVLEFLRLRLATLLSSRGLRPDVVEAVLVRGFDDPVEAARRAEALTRLMSRSDWEPLVVTFKRTINILPPRAIGPVDPGRFADEAERALHERTEACRPEVTAALEARDYERALTELAALRPAVDRFFDAVLVMDKDAAVQENRLALLKEIARLLLAVADLRKIQSAA